MNEMNDGETEIKVAQKGIKKKQKLSETDENGTDDNNKKGTVDDKNGMDDENGKIIRTKWMKGTKG
ncbi:hypothetical protein RhiirA5_430791 [Rhizophagus irregularis]|uniref:Uncharacterized protein n=1 Tax=Rhizophagus irregularis TaxID=588596 RepID=A0A2N0NW57_9GLOM|nr:hypothetical protein RhiirA5_430791 [Rhizophagus irregularis]